MSQLLLVSLGPVQDFIASARRCQDLWFGSWLLSELAQAVAEAVAPDRKRLIFPASFDQGDEAGAGRPGVANKILVELADADDARAIAERGKAAMASRLKDLRDEAFRGCSDIRSFDAPLAAQQIDGMMEYFWVVVPFATPVAYSESRERAETLLAARKNSKDWEQFPWTHGHNRPKSSADGVRESVIDPKAVNDKDRARLGALGLRPSEHPCGVALFKRIGTAVDDNGEPLLSGIGRSLRRKPTFHSTTHMAAAPLLTRLARDAKLGGRVETAVADYVARLCELGVPLKRYSIGAGTSRMALIVNAINGQCLDVPRTFELEGRRLDGCLLYSNRLTEIIEDALTQSDGGKVDRAILRQRVEQAEKPLRDCLRALGISEPNAYFALLQADGDHMGRALDSLRSIDHQKSLARAIDRFATRCDEVVTRHGGSLIYSGGDDVLALLPLHTALQCAQELRDRFIGNVDGDEQWNKSSVAAIARDLGVPADALPTLSAGLALVHHMEPLDDSRRLAQDAERRAKDAGRNRLCVTMSKRSGGNVQVVHDWADGRIDGLYSDWMRLLDDEALPDGVAFELLELLVPFEVTAADPTNKSAKPSDFDAVLEALASRVIRRKRGQRGAEKLNAETLDKLANRLKPGRGSVADRIRQMADEIQVARLILGAHEQAWGGVKA